MKADEGAVAAGWAVMRVRVKRRVAVVKVVRRRRSHHDSHETLLIDFVKRGRSKESLRVGLKAEGEDDFLARRFENVCGQGGGK